jgi:hypothetical protein
MVESMPPKFSATKNTKGTKKNREYLFVPLVAKKTQRGIKADPSASG